MSQGQAIGKIRVAIGLNRVKQTTTEIIYSHGLIVDQQSLMS